MNADEIAVTSDKTTFGFWVYIMTDCVLFASLFAVYAVMHTATAGGPSGKELFDMPYVLKETMLLLFSSFTCGLAMLGLQAKKKQLVMSMLAATFILGAGFLGMELNEFHHLATTGASWTRSGFLSSYFTLVATHGLHITVGLIWIIVMMLRLSVGHIDNPHTVRKLTLLSMFWHFLDVVWIFIFSVVYLLGAIGI